MYYYIHISERIYSDLCRVKRIFYRNPKPLNGHAPFFLAILDPLDKNERIYSDFYALFKPILAIIVGGLNRSDWVGMLRFQHVNIPRNDYGFTFWKFIYFIVCIIHAVCFPNMDEVFPE